MTNLDETLLIFSCTSTNDQIPSNRFFRLLLINYFLSCYLTRNFIVPSCYMNWFLAGSKRPAPAPSSNSVWSPCNKKSSVSAKQGNATANVRVEEFGRDLFHGEGGKLFCRPCNLVVDHYWKHTITKHLANKVILLFIIYFSLFTLIFDNTQCKEYHRMGLQIIA